MAEIRKMEDRDLSAALELCAEIREHHRRLLGGYFKPLDQTAELEILKSFLNNRQARAWVAIEKGCLAGLLTATFKSSPWLERSELCHIETVVVTEKFRRLGIGQQLMDQLCVFCRENAIDEIKLGVFNANLSAGEFYKNYGFVPQEQKMSLKLTRD